MTYQELLELKSSRAAKVKEGTGLLEKKDFEAHRNLMDEVSKMNAEIDAAEAQLAEEGRFDEKDEKLKVMLSFRGCPRLAQDVKTLSQKQAVSCIRRYHSADTPSVFI